MSVKVLFFFLYLLFLFQGTSSHEPQYAYEDHTEARKEEARQREQTPGKWPETKRVPRKIKTARRERRTKGWTGEGEKAGWISTTAATRNRARRGQDKESAPDSSTGQEGTITLQDYLPEMFFPLVGTRGFFNYSYNETVEFQNILQGKIQPGDNVHRLKEDQEDVSAMDLHPCPQFASWLHGIIIVVKANDPRLREGALKDYLKPVRDILRRNGNVVLSNNTGSPSSKNEHRRASALLRNIQNIRICMGKKTYRFCNLRKWKDFNKKQLTLHKMCECYISPVWSTGRFIAVLWVT